METKLERRSGVSLWRQVADCIRQQLLSDLAPGDKLPPEIALARRFGVNRHTVRAAIAALESEGILRAEQGRGTFLANRRRLRYPIGKRTRFSAGLSGQTESREGRLIEATTVPAPAEIAAALALATDQPALRLDTVSLADGVAISRARSWFDGERLAGLDAVYREIGSITRSLARFGVDDYTRKYTAVSATHAGPEDLARLSLSPGAIVMVTRALNIDSHGRPLEYAETRFAADRMEFVITQESD